MKNINSELRKLVLRNGIRGTLLLIFLNYGFFSFAFNLVDLVTDFGAPAFGGPWGVLLFSCGMASAWLLWPYKLRYEKNI